MTTQPEIDRMAKILARELSKQGLKLKHLQAVALVTKMVGSSSITSQASRTRKQQLDAMALATEHAITLMFQSTGRYGSNVDLLFDELDAAFALKDSADVEKAVWHVFQAPQAPRLLPHIEAQHRFEDLHALFNRFVSESLRLVDRTLFEARNLHSAEPEVLFQGPMRDWRVQEGYPLVELPEKAKTRYEGRLTRNGSQFRFTIAPAHVGESEIVDEDQLSLLIEIHEGRPCVRITSAVYGEQVLTIFGTRTGTHLCFENDPLDPALEDLFALEAHTAIVLKAKP